MFQAKGLALTGLLVVLGCGADASPHASKSGRHDAGTTDAAVADTGEPPQIDAAVGGEAGLNGDASSDASADAAAENPTAPRFTSFETASPITPGTTPALISITHANQETYFSFDGEVGQFCVFSTEFSNFSPDNVIQLYDESRTILAENDEGQLWPGDGIDARLVVRLPATGHYFIKVRDSSTPPEFFQNSAFPLTYYHLKFTKIDASSSGFAIAGSGNAPDAEFAKDDRSGYGYLTVVGELHPDATDTVNFKGAAEQALIGHVLPSGIKGSGASTDPSFVRIQTAAQHPLAQIEHGKGQEYIHPPLTDGSYQLKLQAKPDVGANGFFVVDLVLLPDNPREHAEQANDKLAGAEPIQFMDAQRRRGLLLTSLPAADVDYFRFDMPAGLQHVLIACEGESGGSGVRKLRAELRDATDHTLVFGLEPPTENLMIQGFMVPSAGTYYLRLSSETPADSNQPEPWTRCVVRLGA